VLLLISKCFALLRYRLRLPPEEKKLINYIIRETAGSFRGLVEEVHRDERN